MTEPKIITEIKQRSINNTMEKQMDKQLQLANAHILETKSDFKKLAEVHEAVDFEIEASYAYQILKSGSKPGKPSFLTTIALSNPDSLKYAILNVASIGLTLNPTTKYAYLVPRSGAVCLDISYMGMVQLACESGALKWVQVELVHELDSFQFQGVGSKPLHTFNAFQQRGNVIGVYCVAKTEDGEYLTEIMSATECYAIRDRSEAWKRNQSGPWKTDPGEMMKKTVIKRAFKLWPKNDKTERLANAIEIANQSEGINFQEEVIVPQLTETQHNTILDLLLSMDKKEDDGFFNYVSRVCKREIETLEDLNTDEAKILITQLEQFSGGQSAGN